MKVCNYNLYLVEAIFNELSINNYKSNDIILNSRIEKFDVSKKLRDEGYVNNSHLFNHINNTKNIKNTAYPNKSLIE